jgi:predicted transcriptional regulator
MGWLADILQELPVSAALKAKLEKKEAEYEALKRDHDKLAKENEDLKKKIAAGQQSSDLSNEETEILKVLAHASDDVRADQIARHFQMHQTKAEHFLNELQEKGLIDAHYYTDGRREYYLTRDGKKLAVKMGFV